jgi:hypothetical protein
MAAASNFTFFADASNVFDIDKEDRLKTTWTFATFILDFTVVAVLTVGSISMVLAIT